MYPVNDSLNNDRYSKYKDLSKDEPNIIFGGRLAEYKYFNMDQVIKSSLSRVYDELYAI
jgi:UDP-galactopyranose mutase